MDTLEIGTTQTTSHGRSLRELITFVGSASRTDGHSIGFLTYGAYEEAHAHGHLVTLARNADLVGFLLFSTNRVRELRILQIWVRRDARLILHGRMLVDYTNDKAAWPSNCWTMRLWCAEDLEANLFWPAMHFERRTWRWGPAKRPRRHILWTRPVTPPLAQQISRQDPQASAERPPPNLEPTPSAS